MRGIVGAVFAVPDVRTCSGEESLCMLDALRCRCADGFGLRLILRGQAINLLDVEHGATLVGNGAFLLLAVLVLFGLGEVLAYTTREPFSPLRIWPPNSCAWR